MPERPLLPNPAGAAELMRHLIALHGWDLQELVQLQERHHWNPTDVHFADHEFGATDHVHSRRSGRPRQRRTTS
jgi:hypothetical protein